MKFKPGDEWEDLEQKVKFLRCLSRESVETHLSWVFLTDDRAYKLKKPVHFSYLDHSTLKSRQRDVENEISLNRDLAPGTYLGAVPLTLDEKGDIQVGEGEQIIDWLVMMKRFPRELTLNERIADLKTDDQLLVKAARKLVRFYQDAIPVNIGPREYLQRLEGYVKENFLALSRPRYDQPLDLVSKVHEWQLEILTEYQEHFFQRALEMRIIDAHGDLRPEHICLTDPPILVDRLEFNQEFRFMDPVDELSYLTLECGLLGRPEIGDVFYKVYLAESDDDVEDEIVRFYRSFRAALRAKISLWHLDDPRVIDKEKHIIKGRRYLNLAISLLERPGDTFPEVPPEILRPPRASWHEQKG